MQLALIPPNSMLSQIELTRLHLLLPWQITTETEDFVKHLPGHKILDNGAAEGDLLPLNRIGRILDTGLFNEVVAPDRLKDMQFTLQNARLMRDFKTEFPDIAIMGVAQGKDLGELVACVTSLTIMEWIDVIGIPRVVNIQFGRECRVRLVESMEKDLALSEKPIHCLGAYYGWPEEIKYLKQFSNVRSMDSSLPYVLGFNNVTFDDDVFVGLKRPDDYFNLTPSESQLEVMTENVLRYIRWSS